MINVSRIKRLPVRVPIFEFPIKLEIGCGDEKHRCEGYVGLDIEDFGQEIIWDVETGIPLPDNSCSEIYASHIIEHIEDFIGVMNECHRVLRPEGELWIITPHKESEKALVPSHVRLLDQWSFDFFQYESYTKEYHSSLWEVIEFLVNERKDIHVKMRPKK